MSQRITRLWYTDAKPLRWLAPLARLFGWLSARRRQAYHQGRKRVYRSALPVLVIGNLTAGGTGKSPFTAWLAAYLRRQGWRPVILSRGYGAHPDHYPFLVVADSDPEDCGDEPVMLAQQTGLCVLVDPRRARAAQYAEQQNLGDILICDDGLQHYALERDLEFCIFDGAHGPGNGELLPVGPLREGLDRVRTVDFCLSTGAPSHAAFSRPPLNERQWHGIQLVPKVLRRLVDEEMRPLEWLNGRVVNAVAGIAHPTRFFDTLNELGARVIPHAYGDHHRFQAEDLSFLHGPVVMTAKDAVKCRDIAGGEVWVLDVIAQPGEAFETLLEQRLAALMENAANG